VLLPSHESTTHAAKAAVAATHKMKVLVVDDSGDAAQSAVMLLETLGHDARIAPDGAAAMKMALEYVPDYGRESDRERSREAGFDQHLVKPVDFARIESILSAAASKAD
jgi:CheY-like chemotaxis protein